MSAKDNYQKLCREARQWSKIGASSKVWDDVAPAWFDVSPELAAAVYKNTQPVPKSAVQRMLDARRWYQERKLQYATRSTSSSTFSTKWGIYRIVVEQDCDNTVILTQKL